MSYRYKLTVEYIGTNYCGWQRQPKELSIQEVIEKSIYSFSKERITLQVAGRTDAGVHAYNQIVHFDSHNLYNTYDLIQSINHFMQKESIGIKAAEIVDKDFHARFSAKSRDYVYRIINREEINIVDRERKLWIRDSLNIKAMQEGANYLIGTHNFSSFRGSDCQAKSPVKQVNKIEIICSGQDISIYFSASSFLHHMVRNIIGTLIWIGRGKYKPIKVQEILHMEDRRCAGPTAPAHGLYLLSIEY